MVHSVDSSHAVFVKKRTCPSALNHLGQASPIKQQGQTPTMAANTSSMIFPAPWPNNSVLIARLKHGPQPLIETVFMNALLQILVDPSGVLFHW